MGDPVGLSDAMLATTAWTQPRHDAALFPNPLKSEDDALMLRVQSGDEAALAQLLERHARLVLGIGYRILRDAGEAQELVQDVFLVAYRKCRLFDPQRGSFRAWLGRIAYRRALDRREYLNLHRFTMAAIWMTLPMCFRPPQMWSIRLS